MLFTAICCGLLGHWAGTAACPPPPAPPAWLEHTPRDLRVCGRVEAVQGLTDRRLRVFLSGLRPASEKSAAPLPGLTAWTWEKPDQRPLPGQEICLGRRPWPLQGLANSRLPDWERSQRAQGVFWRIWSRCDAGAPGLSGQGSWPGRLRGRIMAHVLLLLAESRVRPADSVTLPPGKAMLMALIFGDKFYLDSQTQRLFAQSGLAHSLALSGQHLAVAALLGWLGVLAAGRLFPHIYLWRPRPMLALWAGLTPALIYVWLGNAPPSLLRAAVMLCLLIVWASLRGAPTCLDLLLGALLCITLCSPAQIFSPGLQLSALCVGVIALALPWLARLKAPASPWPLRRLIARIFVPVFFLSICIQGALLPAGLLLFNTAPLAFPLNALWLPALGALVLPLAALGLGLALVGLNGPAGVALTAASLPCQWLTDLLGWLQGLGALAEPALLIPHWTALPAYGALLTALALLTPGCAVSACRAAGRLLLAGALLLCVGPLLRLSDLFQDVAELTVHDVGQGLAMSLRLPRGLRLVLDGGGSASPRFDPGRDIVARCLAANMPPRIGAIVSSHPDLDHAGGLPHILAHFRWEQFLHNGREAQGRRSQPWRDWQSHARALTAHAGMELRSGDCRLEILHPPSGSAWQGNNASLILRLARGDAGLALLAGDAEIAALRELVASGADLRARVVVAPHHGSDRSFLADLYRLARPEIVIVSAGAARSARYPGRRLKSFLEKRGVRLLSTWRDGEISVIFKKDGNLDLRLGRKGPAADQ